MCGVLLLLQVAGGGNIISASTHVRHLFKDEDQKRSSAWTTNALLSNFGYPLLSIEILPRPSFCWGEGGKTHWEEEQQQTSKHLQRFYFFFPACKKTYGEDRDCMVGGGSGDSFESIWKFQHESASLSCYPIGVYMRPIMES